MGRLVTENEQGLRKLWTEDQQGSHGALTVTYTLATAGSCAVWCWCWRVSGRVSVTRQSAVEPNTQGASLREGARPGGARGVVMGRQAALWLPVRVQAGAGSVGS